MLSLLWLVSSSHLIWICLSLDKNFNLSFFEVKLVNRLLSKAHDLRLLMMRCVENQTKLKQKIWFNAASKKQEVKQQSSRNTTPGGRCTRKHYECALTTSKRKHNNCISDWETCLLDGLGWCGEVELKTHGANFYFVIWMFISAAHVLLIICTDQKMYECLLEQTKLFF